MKLKDTCASEEKLYFHMATSRVPFSRGSLSCLQPIQEALQDLQVGLTHASFKLVLVYWDLECVTFCMHG